MRHQSFTHFAQQYARARSGRGTYVTFGGTTAFVSGRHINLPALPPGTVLSNWQVDVYNGYLDHEIGHLKYTEWMPDLSKDKTLNPAIRGLWNLVEDIRIENLSIRDFPTTKIYLDACTQQLEYDKRAADEEEKNPKPETVANLAFNLLYKECYGVHRNADVLFEEKRNLADFPEFEELRQELTKIKGLTSSRHSLVLARRIYELLPKDVNYGADLGDFPLGPNGELPLIIFVGGGGMGQARPMTPEMIEALNNAILIFLEENDRAKTVGMTLQAIAADNDLQIDGHNVGEDMWDGNHVLPPCGMDKDKLFEPIEPDLAQFQMIRASVQTEVTSVKRMLQIYLQTRSKKAWERGLQEGTLDTEQLSRLHVGNTDIFKEKRTRTMIDTAVQVLIDLSGSMSPSAIRLAGIMLAEALNGVPSIKTSIAGFTTGSESYPNNGGGRMSNLYFPLFKDFGESYASSCGRLGSMETSGLTPLGDAYAQGLDRLIVRKEPRRILWIVTDGAPELTIGNREHNEFLLMKNIYKRCKRHKIEVISMNIGGSHRRTKEVCDTHRYVDGVHELPNAILEMLKEIAK